MYGRRAVGHGSDTWYSRGVDTLIERHRPDLERLCRRFRVSRLELFGSAATGAARPGESDFDFLVEFEELPPAELVEAYFGLLEALEEFLEGPVDLVVAAAAQNPYFRQSVERSAVLLYAA